MLTYVQVHPDLVDIFQKCADDCGALLSAYQGLRTEFERVVGRAQEIDAENTRLKERVEQLEAALAQTVDS